MADGYDRVSEWEKALLLMIQGKKSTNKGKNLYETCCMIDRFGAFKVKEGDEVILFGKKTLPFIF